MSGLSSGSGLIGGGSSSAGGYVRPSDWPTVPTPSPDGLNVLTAVFPVGGNFVALNVTVVGGYTVNWGDGVTDNWASGVQAEHTYNYVTLSTSVTSRGYKTAIVKVVPQTPGASVTAFSFAVKSSAYGTFAPGSNQWLDITVNTPSATSILFSSAAVKSAFLEITTIVAIGNASSLTYCWEQAFSLQSCSLPANFGATATSLVSIWTRCESLRSLVLPAGFGSAALNVNSMFNACYSLTSTMLPAGFGSVALDVSSMFNSCYSLTSITLPPGFGAHATTFYNMFAACTSLSYVTFPPGCGAACTTIEAICFQADGLKSIIFPTGFGPGITSIVNAFNGCPLVESIAFPSGFGSAITLTTSAFASCANLESITGLAVPITFSVGGCKLGAAALNAIYTALPTVVGQTLTASTNYGYAASTPTIATAKGWIVN